MTSAEFIRKWHNVEGRERTLSSIYKDSKGNIYSYGSHYPLLFTVNGLDFVNTRGYSSTTGKHIAWAHRATDYTAVSVELNRGERMSDITINTLLLRLMTMRDAKQAEMDSKKRKDTSIYQLLTDDLARIDASIERVRDAM